MSHVPFPQAKGSKISMEKQKSDSKKSYAGNRRYASDGGGGKGFDSGGCVCNERWICCAARQRIEMIIKAAILAAVLAAAPLDIQDPVTASGYSVKIEFENEQIRVLRVRYAPHATSPMHSHTGRAVVAITPSHLRVTTSDGDTRETQRHAGEIYWGDSVTHSAENLSDAPLETVEVELKKATSPAAGVQPKADSREKGERKEPVPVEQESHHHVVLENQYVRVLDVFFPVGEPALFHTHSNDNVSVELSGDKTKSQPWGGEWSTPGDVVPGRVAFHKAVGQPYTHRVGSAGGKPFHVIDVEIFPSRSE